MEIKSKSFLLRRARKGDIKNWHSLQQEKEIKKNFMTVPKDLKEARDELLGKSKNSDGFVIDVAGENVFGIGIYDEGIGFELADFTVQKLSAKTIGVLYNNVDPFVLLVVNSFEQQVGERAKIIVERYQPEDKDFRTQLLKLKNEQVDALLIIGFDEAGLAARQAREIGITAPLLGIDTVLSEGYKNNAGIAYEEMYFTSWLPSDKAAYDAFVERYKTKFGEDPQQVLFAATGYDAAKTLFSALEKSTDPSAVKNSLASLQNAQGLTGTLTMSPDGIVRSVREQMHQIQNGQPVALS